MKIDIRIYLVKIHAGSLLSYEMHARDCLPQSPWDFSEKTSDNLTFKRFLSKNNRGYASSSPSRILSPPVVRRSNKLTPNGRLTKCLPFSPLRNENNFSISAVPNLVFQSNSNSYMFEQSDVIEIEECSIQADKSRNHTAKSVPVIASSSRKGTIPVKKDSYGSLDKQMDKNKLKTQPKNKPTSKEDGFFMPSPAVKRPDINIIDLEYNDSDFDDFDRLDGNSASASSAPTCPICYIPLPLPLHPKLATALTNITILKDKIFFCQLHETILTIIPEGLERGYPKKIKWQKLEARIRNMRAILWDLICNRVPSEFRELALDAYRNLGRNRARSILGIRTRYEELKPGYYGPKGSQMIHDVLMEMFLLTGKIKKKHTAPQEPLEFVSEVLLPEVALRLIAEDRGISILEARIVMKESVKFGEAVNKLDDDILDSDEEGSIQILNVQPKHNEPIYID